MIEVVNEFAPEQICKIKIVHQNVPHNYDTCVKMVYRNSKRKSCTADSCLTGVDSTGFKMKLSSDLLVWFNPNLQTGFQIFFVG